MLLFQMERAQKPPASSHRWKTLQAYLREQNRLLALERAGQVASEMERDRFDSVLRTQRSFADGSLPATPKQKRKSFSRSRASTILPSGITVERVDVDKDEKEAKARWKAAQKASRRRTSASSPVPAFPPNYPYQHASRHPAADSTASLRSIPLDLRPPSMPGAGTRRFSSPLLDSGASLRGSPMQARSSADLRSSSPSPGGRPASLAPSERPRSYFSRNGPRSASASVLSFAASGSMIDMHLGLSMDKHLPTRPDDDLHHASDEEAGGGSTKKKRRTLNKILSRLNLRSAPPSPSVPTSTTFSPRASVSILAASPDDIGPLEPPFPSYLAGDPALHRRSPTVSTASTSPVTPDLTQLPPVLAASTSSSSQLPLRREKSLPALPVDLFGSSPLGDDPHASPIHLGRPSLGVYDRTVSAPAVPAPAPSFTGSASPSPRRSRQLGLAPTHSTDSTEHIGGGVSARDDHSRGIID
jgi:hypothetical protein